MPKKIIGTCEYAGRVFNVKPVTYKLFKAMLHVDKDPLASAEAAMEIVKQCIVPEDGLPFNFEECPWSDIADLSKLTMANPEGAGAAFTIKPAN
jgi:hypothetical protein